MVSTHYVVGKQVSFQQPAHLHEKLVRRATIALEKFQHVGVRHRARIRNVTNTRR